MRIAGGRLLAEEGLVPGTVHLDREGRVARIERGEPPREPDLEGVVAPRPANAHTHLADWMAREKIDAEGLSVEEAVAPPDGLKHRVLRTTPSAQRVDSMRQALEEAHEAGVRRVWDFREGGPQGARELREAAEDVPVDVEILGRPSRVETWEEERALLADLVDGLGVSGLADQPLELTREQAAWTREHGKRLAVHFSEVEREDVDEALALEPDLLVHGTHCTREDARRIAEADVALAACPRANHLFGNRPPLDVLVDEGVRLGLGTDNAMFHETDPMAEAAFVAEGWPSIDAEEILRMACSFGLGSAGREGVCEDEPVLVVDDSEGLREGLENRRIHLPGRIDDG